MQLTSIDWIIIAIYGICTFLLGTWYTRRAGKNIEEYFIAGRTLPWYVAGISIAVTWFASDAPLAAASLVRQKGIFGNWLWWYEAAGVMFLAFFYARLWRRANIITDAEFIELRYSGKQASVLRGFTAIYHGMLRNCVVMGWVILAMVKFSQVLLGWDPWLTIIVCVILAVLYTVASGLYGVVMTDMFQFVIGMIGSIIFAGIVMYELGGPSGMVEKVQALTDAPAGALDLLPDSAGHSSLEMFSYFCLIFILWLRSAQGDGYIAQRLFATKNEKHALYAAFLFTFVGIVMITWPWIIVGIGSLVYFPISSATAELAADPELAYPMMMAELMPVGLKGLLVATFLAAFMSTMDTHLCWGGSYLVNDVYKRFIYKDGSDRHYVQASRLSILILVLIAAVAALNMNSIERAWIYIIDLMAGLAIVWMLRWYWWRVNAWAEIASMVGSIIIANGSLWGRLLFNMGFISESSFEMVSRFYGSEFDMIRAVTILLSCTLIWITVALLTKPDDVKQLEIFYRRVRPGGWWGPIAEKCPDVKADDQTGARLVGWFLGSVFIYSSILGIGHMVTGALGPGLLLLVLSILTAWGSIRMAKAGFAD